MEYATWRLTIDCICHAVNGHVFGCLHRHESLTGVAVAYTDALLDRFSIGIVPDHAIIGIGHRADAAFAGNQSDAATILFDLDESERVSAAGILISHDDIFLRSKHDVSAGGNGLHSEIVLPYIIDVDTDANSTEASAC